MCMAHMPDTLQEGSQHAVALPHLKCEMGVGGGGGRFRLSSVLLVNL